MNFVDRCSICGERLSLHRLRTVSFIALDKTFSGTLPQLQFLQDFQARDGAQEEGGTTLTGQAPQRILCSREQVHER